MMITNAKLHNYDAFVMNDDDDGLDLFHVHKFLFWFFSNSHVQLCKPLEPSDPK